MVSDHPQGSRSRCDDSQQNPPAANIMEPKSDHQTGTAGCKYTARTHKHKLEENTSIAPSENHPSVSNKRVLLKISFPHRQGRWDQVNTNGVAGTKGLLPPFLASLTIGDVAWFPTRPRNVMCRPRGFRRVPSPSLANLRHYTFKVTRSIRWVHKMSTA